MATSKSFSSGVALYAVADGHNGPAAARHVQAALPAELERQLGAGPGAAGPASVLRGLARTFVAVDDAVCRQHLQSGARGAEGVRCSAAALPQLRALLPCTAAAAACPCAPDSRPPTSLPQAAR